MSTEFLYREKDGGACGLEPYSLHVPGSSGGGPWALRPKRLQWLTNITTGFKIAAFPSGLRPIFFFQNSDPGQSLAGAFPSILTLPCESGARLS